MTSGPLLHADADAFFVAVALRSRPELAGRPVAVAAHIFVVGDALFDLFHEFTAAVEPGSIEEAFLDVGTDDWDAAIQMGQLLRHRSAAELGIPVTVGVGRTKLMAKLASRAGKPNGLHVIRPEDEELYDAIYDRPTSGESAPKHLHGSRFSK